MCYLLITVPKSVTKILEKLKNFCSNQYFKLFNNLVYRRLCYKYSKSVF